jgi:hypothetical protein
VRQHQPVYVALKGLAKVSLVSSSSYMTGSARRLLRGCDRATACLRAAWPLSVDRRHTLLEIPDEHFAA